MVAQGKVKNKPRVPVPHADCFPTSHHRISNAFLPGSQTDEEVNVLKCG